MAEWKADAVRLRLIRATCRTCSLSDLCLPVALESLDVDVLDNIVQRRRPLSRGEVLYRAGARFEAIYAVRTGAVKSMYVSEDGEEHITAFYLPGELVGLDAISFGTHSSTACAMETTSVCEIPFKELEDLAEQIPGLQRQLLRLMSKEIFSEQEMLHALARRTAEQRLAILLISLSDRFSRRGLSATRCRLPMSRHDISNYLGLAPETMSRLFRRFIDNGWITAAGKEISLEDPQGLRAMANGGTATMQREAGWADRVR
ncbi:fumarate/nitrate reduction transcriptional regulator Fnr [Aquisalimonas sp.]|uniref:fumarate/nitrate reduction transcriptional regulator Fnr n=1 Tax=Aquisalimonas sp. TaxID=1872621 RepID=UPI0025C5AC84|nr:fumarate/nitrate reduction transcriptional regulator Fnr [Aquisalimonas sp.]